MEELIAKAWQVRLANFPKAIEFDFPVNTKAVSVTGASCGLKCAHCDGHYLKKMVHIDNWQKGLGSNTTSCLISGGCDDKGKVPILRYLPTIEEIRASQRKTNLHVGLLEDEEIEKVSSVADVVSFDFVGDDETIREVYGLNKSVTDYIHVYNKLKEKVTVLPHICIGLRGGKISGEYQALELLQKLGVKGLVFIVFAPTAGTIYAEKEPPSLAEVAEVLCQARIAFPDVSINLGCMRPKGRYRAELDHLALRCGVNKIVQPTSGAIKLANQLGLLVHRGEECCVL